MAARPLLLSLHGGAGALFGVLLFVVLFSGAWSLGHDDLREWLRAPAQAGGEALALERLLERAGEEGVDIRDATLLLPAPGHAPSASAMRAWTAGWTSTRPAAGCCHRCRRWTSC
ncbi:hypothetical protein [Pseudomonas aeruginosa]|uniref:hypothetical protein n=1 Tax=Pseudomonas aeruginosa TaxID=287 RepID=UPI003D7AC4BC|nr:hypothetical protein [Pseudomonas aeruginosa]